MSNNIQRNASNTLEPTVPLPIALLIFFSTGIITIAIVLMLPLLFGPGVNVAWDLTRTSGIVAYLVMWLSIVFGLLITNRLAQLWPGGPVALDLHQFTSLLGLAFSLFHAFILLGDHYVKYTLAQILIPFASSNYQPIWVGMGQLAFYLLIPVTFSFYMRRSLGAEAWRLVHAASFFAFAMITIHGLLAGSDSKNLMVLSMYAVTGASVVFLTIYRMMTMVVSPPAQENHS
ncbi:MAG: ferric reductase-like transmembrane domain-containing protein [Chloroflexi bacterium]|nr:ferric reductase-like transmembrane domain-containing protein [Chloroflexota bacterium]